MTSADGAPGLSAPELDALYTKLCYRLSDCGTERTPMVLARLVLLLMGAVGDAGTIEQAIDDALEISPAG